MSIKSSSERPNSSKPYHLIGRSLGFLIDSDRGLDAINHKTYNLLFRKKIMLNIDIFNGELEIHNRNEYTLDKFSNRQSIYLLISKGIVVYIGQSENAENRIRTHKKRQKVFDSFAFIDCPRIFHDDIESILICTYRPAYNITVPKNIYKTKGGLIHEQKSVQLLRIVS